MRLCGGPCVKDVNLREHLRATFSFGRVCWKTFNARTCLHACYPDFRRVLKLGLKSPQDANIAIGSDRFWDIDFEMKPSIILQLIRCVKLQSISFNRDLTYQTYLSNNKGRIKQSLAVSQLSHPRTGPPNLANRMRQLWSCWLSSSHL